MLCREPGKRNNVLKTVATGRTSGYALRLGEKTIRTMKNKNAKSTHWIRLKEQGVRSLRNNILNMNHPLMMALMLVLCVCSQAQGPFCGIVGTEGCTAVKYDDPRIIGWATGCTVVFGPVDLLNHPDSIVSFASNGDNAIGQAWTNSVYHVVPLGDGGYATVTFDEPIHNVDGFDFAVFENSFDDYFLELAIVEVSSDGDRFVRFPATSLTQTETQIGGIGQVDATYINNLAGKYRGGYGTPFDLEELRDSTGIDIDNITHVRVIDVVGSIDPQYGTYDAYGNIINDPFPTFSYSTGFDLDAVAVLGEYHAAINTPQQSVIRSIYPNPASDHVTISLDNDGMCGQVELFDIAGRRVMSRVVPDGMSSVTISTENLKCGIYILRAGFQTVRLTVAR